MSEMHLIDLSYNKEIKIGTLNQHLKNINTLSCINKNVSPVIHGIIVK